MPASRALVFDMDGVLIDNSTYYAQAWEVFLAEQPEAAQGYPACRTFGRRNADLLPEIFSRQLSGQEITELSRRLEEIYLQLYLPHLAPTTGLPEFLVHAQARGLPLALATSAPAENVPLILGRLGLEETFAAILTERDVSRGKPDGEIYRKAAAALGHAPSECAVFEDSLAGIAAARAAGSPCVALTTSYSAAQVAAAGADLVLADFRDPRLGAWLGW